MWFFGIWRINFFLLPPIAPKKVLIWCCRFFPIDLHWLIRSMHFHNNLYIFFLGNEYLSHYHSSHKKKLYPQNITFSYVMFIHLPVYHVKIYFRWINSKKRSAAQPIAKIIKCFRKDILTRTYTRGDRRNKRFQKSDLKSFFSWWVRRKKKKQK